MSVDCTTTRVATSQNAWATARTSSGVPWPDVRKILSPPSVWSRQRIGNASVVRLEVELSRQHVLAHIEDRNGVSERVGAKHRERVRGCDMQLRHHHSGGLGNPVS